MTRKRDKPLLEAIRRAGGVQALAEALGVTTQAVSLWPRAPVMQVLKIERLTKVSRQQLRPDVYPGDD